MAICILFDPGREPPEPLHLHVDGRPEIEEVAPDLFDALEER